MLGPVLRDWDSSGIGYRVQEDWAPSPYDPHSAAVAVVWTPDSSGTGVLTGAPGEPVTAQVVLAAADALHDAVVEGRLLGMRPWPPCPLHPGTHPLTPRLHEPDRGRARHLDRDLNRHPDLDLDRNPDRNPDRDRALYPDLDVVWACMRTGEVVHRVGELGSGCAESAPR